MKSFSSLLRNDNIKLEMVGKKSHPKTLWVLKQILINVSFFFDPML